MGSIQSEHYEDVQIVNVINEYTVELEFYEENDENKNKENNKEKTKRNLVVTLKGIQPYDWTILEELNRSKNARTVIYGLKSTNKKLIAEIFKTEGLTPECILTEKKTGININHWLITMGHVRKKK